MQVIQELYEVYAKRLLAYTRKNYNIPEDDIDIEGELILDKKVNLVKESIFNVIEKIV